MNTGKQSRSVKTLKGQLFSAVAMIVVAAVALGTSTYAWFISNSTVEVENMELTVSTSTSMTVAVGKKDATSYTGYKTVITNDDITGLNTVADGADWSDMFVYPMDPATVTDTNIAAISPVFFHSLGTVDNNKLTTFEQLAVGAQADADGDKASVGEGFVKTLPLRFLSSSDINVYFGQAQLTDIAKLITPIQDTTGTGGAADPAKQAIYDAQAAAIKAALRVAVVSPVQTGYTDGISTVFQFDAGAPTVVGAGNNTDYNGQNTGTIDEAAGQYRSIATISAATDATEGKILTTAQLTAVLPAVANANYLATVVDPVTVTKPGTGTDKLFTLKGSTPRDVKVYIWLEGTDQDCVSTLSSYKFNLNIPFAGAPVAP